MSDKKIHFKIVTPEKVVQDLEVEQVTVPTAMGEITILPDHLPLIALLKPGELKVVVDGQEIFFAVAKGFIEVRVGNNVVVLADEADQAEYIDLAKAEEAVERARVALTEKSKLDDLDFAKYQALMEKELAKVKVARRRVSR